MRNLTKEAIKLAEQHIISINPSLANKQVREQLPQITKMMIISQLEMLYYANMEQLLSEFAPSEANML